jgi:hypothetical protein
MSDRDDLRRRAEVLQRVADQLSAQLRVERWSNAELRKLVREPVAPRGREDDRAAARRFLTFASVAVLTAAAVALLASQTWRGRSTSAAAALAASPATASILGGSIVPFTVVGPADLDVNYSEDLPRPSVGPWRGHAPPRAIDVAEIFGCPTSHVRLSPVAPHRSRGRVMFDPEDIFGPSRRQGACDVP